MRSIWGGADCDTDRYLMFGKFRVTLAVSEKEAQSWMWRDFRKLNELEFTKEYQIKISYRSVDMEK